jgi:hypothetical protein
MSELDDLRHIVDQRFSALEAEMDALREQITTTRAVVAINDRDVAEFKTELRAHRQTLQALRETQLEQDRKWDARFTAFEGHVNSGFDEVRSALATVLAGIQAIATRLPDGPAAGPEVPAAR